MRKLGRVLLRVALLPGRLSCREKAGDTADHVWSDADAEDIDSGINATDGHAAGDGLFWGERMFFFCSDCQERITVNDLDHRGAHPRCGRVIVHDIDRMLHIGQKVRLAVEAQRAEGKRRIEGIRSERSRGRDGEELD